ncbi:MAG: TldD/PmbA family protein [Bacteroidales bacterium]|nr:TldD/PmbA family protein [Bacteroidales bacterium]
MCIIKFYRYFFCVIFFFVALNVRQSIAQDKLIQILEEELNREKTALEKQDVPPYYIDYRVNDIYSVGITASFGSLISSDTDKTRVLTTSVRVGSYELDNTHEFDNMMGGFGYNMGFGTMLPIEDEPDAIKQILWKQTDENYKNAVNTYSKLKINLSSKDNNNDKTPDFSREEPVEYYEPPLEGIDTLVNKAEWEGKVKRYSEFFLKDEDIFMGIASFSFIVERKYFISTEGTKVVWNITYTNLVFTGAIRSDEGMELPLYKTYFAYMPSGLPDNETILKDVNEIIGKLKKISDAPVVEPYEGPAILSKGSAGVFFHEIFGHRVEGQRQKSKFDGQTFTKKIGDKVLPKTFRVVFDPTASQYKGQDLNGYYKFDDEGIRAQKVNVVENGILKEFLMSRCPVKGFPNSNGHGRAQAGFSPVARQSNLIVETSKSYSMEELRKMLIKECKKQGKDYGYLFKDVLGGFTMTGRYMPNAFNIMPTEVYRIYVDGSPDEMVKGVDLIGTPLAMFAEIKAAGDTPEIFSGTCGAESGGVPVTAISPALFVNQIEIQKRQKIENIPPVLSKPGSEKFREHLKE